MKVIRTVKELQKQIKDLHLSPVGLVPTMGALHKGHLSLVRNAITQCPLVVISIYVNPTQFNDKKDLKNYPRDIQSDLDLLRKVTRKDDIIFIPDDKEIYPVEDKRIFHFGNLDNVMEALHRPGHFNGVAQVVGRLFDIVKPDVAYFGMKDFQQIAVIKELVRQYKYNVKIVGNPIIREPDGLAMSSRNRLLEPEMRKKVPLIYKTISSASGMIHKNTISEIRNYVRGTIEKANGLHVEYFEIVDDTKLKPVSTRREMKKGNRYYGCIAVQAGKIRLIDNIEFPLV
ncbi:MAG: pantoate--beta-alanine ligase [Bacteroidia bacterium]|nr:pantoate--beta-alanine ligase [Bacteroidia bacterium]